MFKSVYTPNYDNFKCGEIFYVSTPDVFNVSCEICNQNLLLDEFVTHFQTHHFNLLEEAISIKLEDNDGSENYMASQGDLILEHEAVPDHDVVSECSNVVPEDDVVAEDDDVVAEDEGILENSFKQEDSDDYVSNNINYDENQQDLRFDYVGKQHKTEDDVYMQEIQIKSKKGIKYKRNSPSKSKPISRNSNNSRLKHTARKRTAGLRQKTSTDTSDPIDVPAALPFSKQLTKNACIRENNIGPDESNVVSITNKLLKLAIIIIKTTNQHLY